MKYLKVITLAPLFFAISNHSQPMVKPKLPPELEQLILTHLPIKDILNFCASSSEKKQLCDENQEAFWEHLVRRDFGKAFMDSTDTTKNWKQIYLENYDSKPTLFVDDQFLCAIKEDGDLACWPSVSLPGEIPMNLGKVVAIASYGRNPCAVRRDGYLQCWGNRYLGKLYRGSRIFTELGKVRTLAMGASHMCVIKENGTPECIGENYDNQATIPENVKRARAITAGHQHTCLITMDGDLTCFGNNSYGQISVPNAVKKAKSVVAGSFHTCAIGENRKVSCWGNNADGQTNVPDILDEAKALALGNRNTCAVKTNGTLLCWGDNSEEVPSDLNYVRAVATGNQTCAVKEDRTLRCWGDNRHNETEIPQDITTVLVY